MPVPEPDGSVRLALATVRPSGENAREPTRLRVPDERRRLPARSRIPQRHRARPVVGPKPSARYDPAIGRERHRKDGIAGAELSIRPDRTIPRPSAARGTGPTPAREGQSSRSGSAKIYPGGSHPGRIAAPALGSHRAPPQNQTLTADQAPHDRSPPGPITAA